MSWYSPSSTASQSTLPPLLYTLSYDAMLAWLKNGTRSRMLSIACRARRKGRRRARVPVKGVLGVSAPAWSSCWRELCGGGMVRV